MASKRQENLPGIERLTPDEMTARVAEYNEAKEVEAMERQEEEQLAGSKEL